MSQIIPILNYEEGYKEKPYLDTEGFPTIACGIKIGPKGASLINYIFTVPRSVGDIWLQQFVNVVINNCRLNPVINSALQQCNPARADILYSMAYQMGINGLAGFKSMLLLASNGDFAGAADNMLNSLWARQTPNRARRHAAVLRSGDYEAYRGLL